MTIGLFLSVGVPACTTATTPDTIVRDAATQPAKIKVPSGTYISVELQEGISTENSSPGDSFTGCVSKDVNVDGLTAFKKGSVVHGLVLDAQEPGREKGRAQLRLVLTSVEHNGKDVPIQTQMYVGIGHHLHKSDVEAIGGAAGIGAAEGASTGGNAVSGTVLVTKGKQLQYPPETRLLFTLASPVEI
jgi:hypothetical protein